MNANRGSRIGGVLIAAFVIVIASAGATQAQTIIRVSTKGSNTNNGSSWALAKRTVQAALNAAPSGGQVWVAAGRYVEQITLKADVALYGGFAGNETDLAQRNWTVNQTTLDGNKAGPVVTSPNGATTTTRIDGFTICDGSASGGAGIYCAAGSPTIANNTITGNTSQIWGGGIYCYSSPTIINNTITGNTSQSHGGGIYCGSSSSPTIANNTIAKNTSDYGSGIYCWYSNPTIANNTITGNTSQSHGSGIYCLYSSPTIANNAITKNSASVGGGIFCDSSSPTITNNAIMRNTSQYNGGGISCYYSSPTLANNTISGNNATSGGAIYFYESASTIANTIIAFNSSGIYRTGPGTLTLRNNCAYGNAAYDYSGVTDPTGTDGNISADPSLANHAYTDNAHIQPTSPCADAGDDAVVQVGWLDMDGQARIQGLHVDIGADESDGTIWQEGPYVIVRVSPEGDDANDGSSWTLAKQTVQGGIDAASLFGGDVWVKAGTYLERVTLSPHAHVYGGFAGTESARQERNWTVNRTILDGQKGGPVVTSLTGYQISRIDGFTIRNGSASSGGGIYCDSCCPTIANNAITGNSAPSGGAIYCSAGSPTIANNTIAGNKATSGGAIYCSAGSPMIANNAILSNSASVANGVGGGIYCDASSPTIANNTITGNSASSGGGIWCSDSSPTIVNTIVAFNSSGIYRTGTGTVTLRYDCVYGNATYNYSGVTDPMGADGNLSADPRLADVTYGNTHTQLDSPCADAGDDAVVQVGWLDMDGQARIQGLHVDIGADESDGTTWSGGPYVIVRVSPEGDDANDGSSWSLAKGTVQAGINTASLLGGDVWVKADTYLERITLLPHAHVYGGFAGTENARDERNWNVNQTVLDGQQGGSVVIAQAGQQVSRIDGFTIRNGSASSGGGVHCDSSSPAIANNTITGNSATSGGAVYCFAGSPTIANNAMAGNNATSGGAIYCAGGSPTIADSTITGSSASSGGGIYCASGSPMIANNTVAGNNATSGGAVYCAGGSPTIANTIVAFNSSGVYRTGPGTLTLRHNCAYGNVAYNYSGVTDPTGTDGNISAEPRLANHAYTDNAHIQPDSPCMDAGDDAVVQAGWLDLDGQARIQGSHVDIGADESDGTYWPEGPCVIVRVSPEGDDANDGSSWPLAKRTVQAGINAASLLGGDVWVKAGTYLERVTLLPHAHVYGGFAGTETTKDERNWTANPTILDGQKGGSVVTVPAGHQVSRIDGFTICDGSASSGAGVYCDSSSPTITNNAITGNSASGANSRGGGIYCSAGFPMIADNSITGNSASSGGAVYCSGGSPTISSNTVAGNNATSGGGIYCSGGSPIIARNTMMRNSATGTNSRGGGIYCVSGSPTITNNIITAGGATSGGGICSYYASSTISNNAIVGNNASSGGGVYCSGGLPTIANNAITGNSASSGGGICCLSSSATIANTIVAFNSSGISRTGSGALTLRYNCVWGNTAYNYSGVTDPTGTQGNISADPRFVRNAGPGTDGTWGTDDDCGDLRLQAASPCIDAGDNAALPADTPDLDGDGDTTEPLPLDLAGCRRLINNPARADTGLGTPPIVDMGAYEFIAGDLDGDGDVDLTDFDHFRACFNGPNRPPAGPDCGDADFDVDADVDLADFLNALQRCFNGPDRPPRCP